jgi:hypothetical protein
MDCARIPAYETYGADGLLDRIGGPRNPHSNRVGEDVEKAILDHCLAQDDLGFQLRPCL